MTTPKRGFLPYDPRLRSLARELRKNGTLGEVLLWRAVKNKALGCEFHRQVPIDNYIVDFYCPEKMLALEVDGSGHDHEDEYEKDQLRQTKLESLGVCFLRFRETAVRQRLHEVVATIRDWLEQDRGPE